MDFCQQLKDQLEETERQISLVERAIELTSDPDELRLLTEQLVRLQAQRTELRIAINQNCPLPAAAMPMAAMAAGGDGAPSANLKLIEQLREYSAKNSKLIRKARRAEVARKKK
jgi:hypothetical protein